ECHHSLRSTRRASRFFDHRRPIRNRTHLSRSPLVDGIRRRGGGRPLMATSCSLVLINYRSVSLAVEAIRTARAATQNPLQVIVVDNSVDASEAAGLRSHADILIVSETNLGYGAAVNRARAKSDGEVLLVCNPDVRFEAGSIDTLIAADADVAGPALFWDEGYEWLLPPSDLHSSAKAIDAAIASRSVRWQRSRDRQ